MISVVLGTDTETDTETDKGKLISELSDVPSTLARMVNSPASSKVNLVKLILKMAHHHHHLSLCQEPANESLLVVSHQKKRKEKDQTNSLTLQVPTSR